jgi:hypothetical protein
MDSADVGQMVSHRESLPASESRTSQVSPRQFRTDAERAAYRAETDRLASELTELAGQLNAANYRFLALLAQFDQRNGWSDGATHSCAHWLNWKLGLNLNAAREKIRVAHALESLPQISAAFAKGYRSSCLRPPSLPNHRLVATRQAKERILQRHASAPQAQR